MEVLGVLPQHYPEDYVDAIEMSGLQQLQNLESVSTKKLPSLFNVSHVTLLFNQL